MTVAYSILNLLVRSRFLPSFLLFAMTASIKFKRFGIDFESQSLAESNPL